MNKILILTGCAGFIGIHFLENLRENHGFDYIISIDKMGYATEYNKNRYYELCDSIRSVYNIDCDINDTTKMKDLCDLDNWIFIDDWKTTELYVLDFASESHVDNSITDPFSIYTQNASLPANLLSWIGKENWCRIKAYYHISTDEVYGDLTLEDAKNGDKWFKTTNTLNPGNPYSASKAAQDCFLMSMKHTFNLPVKFIRMANQFGKYQHPEKMLPASILRAINGDTIKVYGNGENIRQWTPVRTTVEVIKSIVDGEIVFDDVIHIANPWGLLTNNQIVVKLRNILKDKGIDTRTEYVQDRKGHDVCYALDTTGEMQCRFAFYYQDEHFDDELERVVDFYIEHKKEFIK